MATKITIWIVEMTNSFLQCIRGVITWLVSSGEILVAIRPFNKVKHSVRDKSRLRTVSKSICEKFPSILPGLATSETLPGTNYDSTTAV